MTEAEWLSCTDPGPMLEFLRGKASDRKLRLFASACCRLIPDLQWDEVWKNSYELAERYADGFVSGKRIRDARKAVGREVVARSGEQHLVHLQTVAGWLLAPAPGYVQIAVVVPRLTGVPIPQAALLRDIFANPFRPVALDPGYLAWSGGSIPKLAQSIYAGRAFDRLPILADALLDAGCDDEDLMAHCRSECPHVRGCWAIDLILGKE
jgi:hypothetical protein